MRKKTLKSHEILELAIENIKTDYMKCEEPEYGPPIPQRNYCKIVDINDFNVNDL